MTIPYRTTIAAPLLLNLNTAWAGILRCLWSGQVFPMKNVPDGTTQTEIAEELPQGMERRLVLRLLSHWRTLCDDRDYPSFFEVDPSAIPQMWDNCFVLEVFEDGAEPRYRAMGETLSAYVDTSLIDLPISMAPDKSLPGVAVSFLDEVLRKGVPISRGDEYFKDDGTKVLYRSILLPISDDGVTISGILGAVNCREVVAS